MKSLTRLATCCVAAALLAACHRVRGATSPAPASWANEGHCWWSAWRTTKAIDTVAAAFARNFTALGLSPVKVGQLGDTAWAQGGPTMFADSTRTGLYAARVVAIRMGDTTKFRVFNVAPEGRTGIPFCGDVLKGARLGATAPREEEPGDTLPMWRRRP